MKQKNVSIDGVDFTLTELSSYGASYGLRQWREKYDTNHFIVKTVHTTFDKSLYSFPHTPMAISELYGTGKFSQRKNIRVLDMPIKFPGGTEYRVPKELNAFDEAISKIISFEHTINSNVNEYFAYLTIDQGYVPANSFQRKPGCHVDGFQGERIKNKRPINRSYIIYDEIPTVFYPQEFRTSHLNKATDNFFLSFDEQSNEEMAITFDPYKILLMNAYTVHRAGTINYDVDRTFFRLSFDTQMFDRYGNTHNPMFDYNWNMVTRDTQKHLVHKRLPYHPDAF